MKKIKVFSRVSLPFRSPFYRSMTVYLILKHFDAPQWLYGTLSLYFAMLWIAFFASWFREDRVDFFNVNDSNS